MEATGQVKNLPHLKPLPEVTLPVRHNSDLSSIAREQGYAEPQLQSILESTEKNLHAKFSSVSFDTTAQPLGWKLTYIVYDELEQPIGWASLDEGKLIEEDIFSLAMSGKVDSQSPDIYHYWTLLLVRCGTDGEGEVYKRVGVGKIEGGLWYEGAETKRVRII